MTYEKSKTKLMAFTAIAILMAASLCGAVVMNETDDVEESDGELVTLTILALSAVIIILAGYIVYEHYQNKDLPSVNQDEVNAAFKLQYFTALATSYQNMLNYSTTVADEISDVMGLSTSYFERMAEIAASELWVQNGTMDADSILLDSTLAENYATVLLNNMSTLNTITENYKDLYTTLSSSSNASAYSDVVLSYNWTGGSISATTGSIYSEYGVGTTVSGTSDSVAYLYDGGTEDNGFVYVYGGSSTITATNGTTYTLSEGRNDLATLGIPNGMYTLQSGRSYIGSLSASYSSNAADLHAATVMIAGDNIAYAINNTTSTDVYCDGTTYSNVSQLAYKISYDNTSSTVDLTTGLTAMQALVDGSSSVYSHTINAASAAWSIFNTIGEASIFVSPSALIPNLDNMDFTSDQIYLIYMAALDQMSEHDWTESSTFTASDVIISEDSLDLICYGTIYDDDGTIVQSDVTFTPMCYLRDQAVRVGTVLWNQPGLAMTWTELDDGTLVSDGLEILETGYTFNVTKIVYKDETYTTAGDGLVLEVTALTNIDGFDISTIDPTPIPIVTDYGIVAQVLVMIIGLFIAVMGFYIKNPIVIIIGGGVAVVGWVFGATIVGWFI